MSTSTLSIEQWRTSLGKISDTHDDYAFLLVQKVAGDFLIHYVSRTAANQFGSISSNSMNAKNYFSYNLWQMLYCSYTEKKDVKIQYNEILFNKTVTGKAFFTLLEESTNLYLLTIHISEESGMSPLSQHNLDPIIGLSSEGKILFSNYESTEILGYRQRHFIGKDIEEIIQFPSQDNVQTILYDLKVKQEAIQFLNCDILNVTGQKINIFLRMIPIIVDGEVLEIQCIWRRIKKENKEDVRILYKNYIDQLTGVWNKQALQEHFLEEQNQAQKNGGKLAILLVDVDRFKRVNESYGMDIGDEVLRMVANRLRNLKSEKLDFYRLNGDEFLFLEREASTKKLELLAKQVEELFENSFTTSKIDVDCDCSIGISVQTEEQHSLETMLQQATQAVYFARLSGDKNWRFFNKKMPIKYQHNALMEGHLRRAVEKGELYLDFQPQIDLSTGKIDSFEALLRWDSPHFGIVSPADFIPIAEESGLIVGIGDWVLEEVAKMLKVWTLKKWDHLRIAVNISPRQFKEQKFIQKIENLIARYQINPTMLELEVTESSMTDVDKTIKILSELKRMKVIISIDDFGTGYSSLSYLKSYPVDIIKIDQTFIKEMDSDPRNEAIAKTIIHLAHSLGLTVIAEGVERIEHVKMLREENCEKAQGFLFSKPVSIEVIEKEYLPVNKL